MKILLSESQFERLMSVDEIGTMGSTRWEATPTSLSDMLRHNLNQKISSKDRMNFLWKNKLNIDGLKDYAFGDEYVIDIFLHDEEMIYGQIILEKFMDGFAVVDIHVNKNFSGKEIGVKIYMSLIDILKSPLYSGASQTVFSKFGIWNKLMNRFPDRVVGFHNGSEQYLDMRDGELYAGDCPVYGHDEDCGDVRLKLKP